MIRERVAAEFIGKTRPNGSGWGGLLIKVVTFEKGPFRAEGAFWCSIDGGL